MNPALKQLPKSPTSHDETFDFLCSLIPLTPIHSSSKNALALSMLSELGTMIEEERFSQTEEESVLAYFNVLSLLVKTYEEKVYKPRQIKGVDVLKDLMAMHRLTQSSFQEEIGDQPVVSRILNGERELTRQHIERLAKRFNVSPAVFFDSP